MKELYTFEQVKAFALIGFYNLLNSANEDKMNLKTLNMFINPLEELYKGRKNEIVQYSNKLLEKESRGK